MLESTIQHKVHQNCQKKKSQPMPPTKTTKIKPMEMIKIKPMEMIKDNNNKVRLKGNQLNEQYESACMLNTL